jgi:Fe-S oxidoreductase
VLVSLSTAEKWALAAVLAASGAAFWLRIRPVLLTIIQSKPDADFTLTLLKRRARDFFWEVLLQAKVIRQRPLPGLAHAFVFWGFCAFALVTLNHIADGFGFPFLAPQGVYAAIAAVFAVFVTVGITGLFVRRFLVRPKWLGDVSPESGVIAALILILMVTYLGAFWSVESSPWVKPLWWMHTLTLAVFLPLIPGTKHLHLMLSPVTIFLSRGSFANIPPLAGDEDFGLDTGKDLTRLVALQAYTCVECGRCTEHCPAANTGKILDPKQIALGVRGYLNEFGPNAEEPLLGLHLSQEAAFQCTTCGACEFQCPVGVEHVPIIVGLRRGAVNTGKWEDEYGTKLFLSLERNGNAPGFSSAERDKFIAREQFPIFDGTQEYCLWLGCMGSYDPAGREIITAFARVMEHLGTSYGVLRKERCTGDPARRLGNDLLFEQLAQWNLDMLAEANVAKIVSICPHCVRTISTDWAQNDPNQDREPPSIQHHTEFMNLHRDRLPQTPSADKIVYHDPCYLGRYRGVYDEPRAVIAQAGEAVDPPRSRERGFCCGAGGGLAFLGEETGERVSHTRAKELVATGADIVAAACPFCNTMFRDALPSISANPPRLLDVAQIVAATLPPLPGMNKE